MATLPGIKLSREPVLRAITIEGAKFLRADKDIGSLEVGKLADIIVLERNYFEVPEDEIARNRVLLTMLGGDVVHVAEGSNFGTMAVSKFPKREESAGLDSRSVGGFWGQELSEEGKAAVRRARGTRKCDHHH